MKYTKLRTAFTMLELVFVIAVLGIVASIGAEIIAQLYSGYVQQRAVHRASIKTEIAALQIANRLTYAIPNTIIARPTDGNITFIPLDQNPPTDYEILQWLGSDVDSFEAMQNNADRRPGWSGFCDVDAAVTIANRNRIFTPGSNFAVARRVIRNLSRGTTGRWLNRTALFFAGNNTYTANTVGYVTGGGNDITGVNLVAGQPGAVSDTIRLRNVAIGNRHISETYQLAWTSYALVPVNEDADGNFDLELRYNFQPWYNEFYNAVATPREILVRKISLFKFKATGNSIRFKLCAREEIAQGEYITICKEKAVIR